MKTLLITISILLSAFIQAQPVYQSSVTLVGTAASAVVNKPAGTAESDLLIASITIEKGSSEIITPPLGWILILRTNNGTDCGLATYYKIATIAEPASYSFGFTNGSKWSVGISLITNVNITTPVDVSLGATGTPNASVSAPSVTTTNNARLVLAFYTNKKASTYTPAASTTERYDAPNTAGGLPSNMMASYVQITAGVTGNQVATATDPENWAAQQIALVPATYSLLPVKLVSFNVVQSKNDYSVQWSTEEEIGSDYFEVQRSGDNHTWVTIARVDASGNSQTLQSYAYTDRNVMLKTVRYRLKQVDSDGRFVYSVIKTFRNTQLAPVTISNSGNKIIVLFSEQVKGVVEYQLISLHGQVIMKQKGVDPVGQVVITTGAAKGHYIIVVRNGSQLHAAQQVIL